MKVRVTFVVDVDFCEGDHEEYTYEEISQSVAVAMKNAIHLGEMEGHTHELSDEISILLDSKIRAEVVEA
jgi:hypothetical protein